VCHIFSNFISLKMGKKKDQPPTQIYSQSRKLINNQHHTCWVLEKLNKCLFHWNHNQKTCLKWYKLGIIVVKKVASFTLITDTLGISEKVRGTVEVKVKEEE
jgi:hypothetical protein